jgi:hypothetical protein
VKQEASLFTSLASLLGVFASFQRPYPHISVARLLRSSMDPAARTRSQESALFAPSLPPFDVHGHDHFWYPSTLPYIKAAGALAFVATGLWVRFRLRGTLSSALAGGITWGAGAAVGTALISQKGAVEEKEAVRRYYLQRSSLLRTRGHRSYAMQSDSSYFDEVARLANMEDEDEAVRQYLASLVRYDLPLVLKREKVAAAFSNHTTEQVPEPSVAVKEERDALAMRRFLLPGANGSDEGEARPTLNLSALAPQQQQDGPAPLR